MPRLRSSIRGELAANTALAVAAIGLVIGLGVYAWLAATLEDQVEAFARHEAHEVSHAVRRARTLEELSEQDPLLDGLFPEKGVLALEVWSLDGHFLTGVPRGLAPRFGRWEEGLRRAQRSESALATLEHEGEEYVRAAQRVEFARQPRWIAVAVVSREGEEAWLASFVVAYTLGLIGVTALSFLGTLLLVRRALRPVEALVLDARVIAREGPQRRLAVPDEGSELRDLAMLLNEMLSRIDASLDHLRRFTGHAGQELRAPLTRLRTDAERALNQGDPLEERECLASVLEEADSLRRVIDALLELAQGEPLDLSREAPFPIHELVDELVDRARASGAERQVSVEARVEAPARVLGSRPLLRRALWNLLENAIAFAGSPGRVEVRLRRSEGCLTVEVADSGPGFGDVDPEQLFAPFAAATARSGDAPDATELEGRGLGLALTRSIASRHGGGVFARRDEALGGACFELRLPARLIEDA